MLDDGSELLTLREAIAHLGKIIPQNDMKEVQAAAHCLTQAAVTPGQKVWRCVEPLL